MTIHIKANAHTVTGLVRLKAQMAEGTWKGFKSMEDVGQDGRCSSVLSPHSGLIKLCDDQLIFT